MTTARRPRRIAARALLLVSLAGGLVVAHTGPLGAQVSPPDPALRAWGTGTSLPEPRTRFGAVHANGFLYVAGGIDADGATTATVFVAPVGADGALGAWTATTPLPGPRRTVRPAYANGYLYLAGGNDGTTFQSSVYRAAVNADGTLGAWTATTPLPVAQTSHSTIASGGYLYVVGGNNGSTCVATVRYAPINPDGSLGAWATTSPLPGDRCGNVEAVTVAGGYLYAAGGYNNVGVTGAVFSAPINPGGTLGPWQTSPNALTTPREYNAVEVLNGYLYVIGGQTALTGGATTSVEVAPLTADGGVGPFSPATALPSPRSEAASEAVNGRLYALGGGTDESGGAPQATVFVTSQVSTPDTAPPVVSVTAPAPGTTVSGSVTVTADATDDTAVAGVQLLLDGLPLGPEVASAPYAVAWDTTTTADGDHTLSAVARDAAGNQATAAAITVTVANQTPAVVAYGLDEGSGPVAVDSSPSANTANLTGGAWTTAGRYGNAITFDGAASLRAGTSVTLGPSFTYQAWVRNAVNDAFETILTVGRDRDLYLVGGVPTFWSGAGEASFGGPLPTDTWTHLALTYDGATLQAYVDGAPYGTPVSAAIEPTTDSLQVGAWLDGTSSSDFFTGTLDEIRVHNRALTQAQLQADLATPITPSPPGTTPPVPVVAYGLDQGSGPAAIDSSATANTATLTGGAWTTAGRYGNAITFDGAASLRAGTDITVGPSFTYQAWVRNPASDAAETILTVGPDRNLALAGGVLRFSDGATVVTFGAALPTDTWTHVALTYDGATLRAFVDGAPSGTPASAALAPTTGTLQVGAGTDGASSRDFFSGTLDEIRVYDGALTQAQIQADLATPID